jgi:predicted Zn-dependent peptidase
MIQTSTLDNGLQIVTEAMPDARSVAFSFWVGTGSRDEVGDELGMSHFLEHLLFKGSETRSALDIAQTIDEVGGDMNAFTTKECTSFYVRVLADDEDVALDILCDIMCAPAFDPEEVESERQVVIEEMLMRADDPGDLAHELFSEMIFDGHPLGIDILGTRKTIEDMSGESIRAFFEHHYRPNNLVFSAAGKLTHDGVVDAVNKRWKGRDGGARPQRTAPVPTVGQRRVRRRDTDQAHLVLGVPAPHRHDMDRYPVSVLDVILGGGMSSRLFQEVREKRGLAYTVYSGFSPYDDTGEMSVYVGTAPERVPEALDVVTEQLQLVRAGVTDVELARAKRHLRSTTLLGLEDVSARMSRIGRSLLQHGNILTVDEVMARIDAVTTDDVARVADSVFAADPVVVAVGPLANGILD